jgi:hypothetical protein
MKLRILLFTLLSIVTSAFAQQKYLNGEGIRLRNGNASNVGAVNGNIYYDLGTNQFMFYQNGAWTSLAGASPVSSVFGRTGIVTAQVGDYSSFYQPLDGDLTAISGLSSTGYAKRTGTDTWTLNGTIPNADLTNSLINFTTGTTGSDFNLSASSASLGASIQFNIPDAGNTSRGLINTGSQNIAGPKSYIDNVTVGNGGSDILTVNGVGNSYFDGNQWHNNGGESWGLSSGHTWTFSTVKVQTPGIVFTANGDATDTNAATLLGSSGNVTFTGRFGGTASLFSTIASSGSTYTGNGTYTLHNISTSGSGWNPSSSSGGSFRTIYANPEINTTGSVSGVTAYGFLYTPTMTANTGLTHYGICIVPTGTNNSFGAGATPTARVHVGVGTVNAGTAPIKINSGNLNTTAEAGAVEYNGAFYATKASGLRFGLGGVIFDHYTDANNSGTGETDLYSYTTPASTLANDGAKLTAKYSGTFNDATATGTIKVYFAGTAIGNTGALTVSSTGTWTVEVLIIRTSSTTARCSVEILTPTCSTTIYTNETDLTSLTLSGTNIIKITGTAGGGGGGSNDITAKIGIGSWNAAANN